MSGFSEEAARKQLRAMRMNVTAISERDRRTADEFAYIEAHDGEKEKHVRRVLASAEFPFRVIGESRSAKGRPRWYIGRQEAAAPRPEEDGTMADFHARMSELLDRNAITGKAAKDILELLRDAMSAAYDDGASDGASDPDGAYIGY